MTWTPPEDLDPEVLALCKTINEHVPGIRTTESCCGHGKSPYRIWVNPGSEHDLLPLLYYLDGCHSGCYGWRMVIYTDCAMSHVTYMIEGPAGAYADAAKIAGLLRGDRP